MLAQLHAMLHVEHAMAAGGSSEEGFNEELRNAKSRYTSCGKLMMPWLKWGPDKTAAESYREAQKRHEDPEYKAALRQLQADMDAEAKTISDAVQHEIQLRKESAQYRVAEKERLALKGTRHGRLPRRR
jgi:hypothetical protein